MSENKHTQGPAALIHAKWLSQSLTIGAPEAAAELLRLHEVEKQNDDLLAALKLVLPMAKGYAAEHQVGSNVAYCDQAEAAISSVNACAGMDDPQSELDQLRQRVAELEAENARLKHDNHNLNWALGYDGYTEMYTEEERAEHAKAQEELEARISAMRKRGDLVSELRQQLSASQLREKQLREAIEWASDNLPPEAKEKTPYGICHCPCCKSLAIPQDDSALREYVAGKMKPMVEALGDVSELLAGTVTSTDIRESQRIIVTALEAARKEL